MRRRLRILRRRREAMLLDSGALVLEMHRHGRFLPDSLQRRAAEAVGTDAELRALSRSLEAGDGHAGLAAGGGSCPAREAALGSAPEPGACAPAPRRTVAAAPAAPAASTEAPEATKVVE